MQKPAHERYEDLAKGFEKSGSDALAEQFRMIAERLRIDKEFRESYESTQS